MPRNKGVDKEELRQLLRALVQLLSWQERLAYAALRALEGPSGATDKTTKTGRGKRRQQPRGR
jgi:hypothetical protein